MKFIVLSPLFQESQAALKLKELGVHLLFCSDLREADLVLKIHGRSAALLIGEDDDGLQLNKIAKASAKVSTIPVILVHSRFTNDQFLEHKNGTVPANGYLRPPVDDTEWMEVVDDVLGTQFSSGQKAVGGAAEIMMSDSEGGTLAGLKVETAAESISESAADRKATENAGGIELDGLFAGGVLETSGLKAAENAVADQPSSLSAEAVENADGIIGEIPIATPIDLAGATPAIDFNLDEALAQPLDTDDGLSLTPDEGESAPYQGTSPVDLDAEIDDGPTNPTIAQISTQRPSSPSPVATDEVDDDALIDMPYLSANRRKHSRVQTHVALNDALVPGGSANPPDVETLKKYLSLRELDVATLSQQLQLSKEHISKIESELKKEKADTTELSFLVQEQEARIKNFEKEKQIALESSVQEAQELKFEVKKRMDKIRLLEIQVRESSMEAEKIKERVRADIRKIRQREKELENRLEIMRKDSEALLAARENRIIELKRKLDLIEFNMDILQNQYEKEKQLTGSLKEKLEKAAQVVRVAEGLLHPSEQLDLGEILTQDLNNDDKTRVA